MGSFAPTIAPTTSFEAEQQGGCFITCCSPKAKVTVEQKKEIPLSPSRGAEEGEKTSCWGRLFCCCRKKEKPEASATPDPVSAGMEKINALLLQFANDQDFGHIVSAFVSKTGEKNITDRHVEQIRTVAQELSNQRKAIDKVLKQLGYSISAEKVPPGPTKSSSTEVPTIHSIPGVGSPLTRSLSSMEYYERTDDDPVPDPASDQPEVFLQTSEGTFRPLTKTVVREQLPKTEPRLTALHKKMIIANVFVALKKSEVTEISSKDLRSMIGNEISILGLRVRMPGALKKSPELVRELSRTADGGVPNLASLSLEHVATLLELVKEREEARRRAKSSRGLGGKAEASAENSDDDSGGTRI